jgi:hypothetical protein
LLKVSREKGQIQENLITRAEEVNELNDQLGQLEDARLKQKEQAKKDHNKVADEKKKVEDKLVAEKTTHQKTLAAKVSAEEERDDLQDE